MPMGIRFKLIVIIMYLFTGCQCACPLIEPVFCLHLLSIGV